MRLIAVALLVCAVPAAATGQRGPDVTRADAYRDDSVRQLVEAARARRAIVDTRITAYEVTAHERSSARLAVAGFERLLWSRETVARIAWTMDTVRIEVLGAREGQPLARSGAVRPPPDLPGMLPSLAFDPVDSEMLLSVDSTFVLHPLAPGSDANYRFASGDTTTIRLPDGRAIRLVELRITARREDPALLNGSFWLDGDSHAVVRAAFRLVRDRGGAGVRVLSPELGVEMDVAIDYGLWDMHWWLPRAMVARATARFAGTRVPISYERGYSDYRIVGDTLAAIPDVAEGDTTMRPCRPRRFGSVSVSLGPGPTDSIAEARWDSAWATSAERVARGEGRQRAYRPGDPDEATPDPCRRPYLISRADGVDLVHSPAFTADVYDAADGGPLSAAELRELGRLLDRVAGDGPRLGRPAVQLLRPEQIRYNRVEGLSASATARWPVGPVELRGEARAGTAGELGGRLAAARSGAVVAGELAAYRQIEAVAVAAQPFSPGGAVSALLLGRDENDYFRGTGAELRLTPARARPQRWELRLFAERQGPVQARSMPSVRGLLDDDFAVRGNIAAETLAQFGAALRLAVARGDDPGALRTRAEVELHGEGGDRAFLRPMVRLGADRHLGHGVAAALALTGGTSVGDVPVQRLWQVGGVATLRGHDPAALRGESLWLARGELGWGAGGVRLALFGDAGWAGERARLRQARPLRAAGVGLVVLDGLLRLDLGHGIGEGGTRLYLRFGGGL